MQTPYSGNDSYDLGNDDAYKRWRDEKLNGYPEQTNALVVELDNLNDPSTAALAAMKERINKTNMVVYKSPVTEEANAIAARNDVRALGVHFCLSRLDANLCADEDAISPLSVAQGGRRGRYIPYTNRPISWHTDGYYNKPEDQIRGMILHCVSPAADGGANGLMDPEIAYILVREENPDYIRALMHVDAMLIPANDEGDGVIRPAQSGPVFSCPGEDGELHMRYTARSRSITWRDDSVTTAAVAFLSDLLKGDSPYIFRHRMAAGEGVLCNNVLHNRSAFEDNDQNQRLFLRARYYDRIAI